MRASRAGAVVLMLTPLLALAAAVPGNLLWSDEFDHAGWWDRASDVAIEGRYVVVAGVVNNDYFGNNGDFLVRGYALRSGRVLWDDRFDRAESDDAATVVAMAGGVAFAAGYTSGELFETDLAVRAYRARDGRLLWGTVYDGGPSDQATGVVADGNTVYVSGQSQGDVLYDFLVMALDADSGERRWVDRYDTGSDDRAIALALGDGRLFVVGQTDQEVPRVDGLIRAYDTGTGMLLWQDRFNIAGGFDSANAVVTGSGCAAGARGAAECVHVAGTVTNSDGNLDFHVRTYDAESGALLWQDTYDPAGAYASATVVVADDGRVFAGGVGTRPGKLDDSILRAYDAATGALLWESSRQSRYSGQGVADLAVGGGRVYAVGSGVKKKWPDYLVRSYAVASGDLKWEAQFDLGKRTESAQAVALASGRLVTAGGGTRRGTGSNSWVLVRAYDAR